MTTEARQRWRWQYQQQWTRQQKHESDDDGNTIQKHTNTIATTTTITVATNDDNEITNNTKNKNNGYDDGKEAIVAIMRWQSQWRWRCWWYIGRYILEITSGYLKIQQISIYNTKNINLTIYFMFVLPTHYPITQ